MRAIAMGHEDCPTLVRTFRHVGGPYGGQTLQTYAFFIKYLAAACQRRLQVHLPGCICVGADEAGVLEIIATAQRSIHDLDETGLRVVLREFIETPPSETLILMAQGVARLLDASALALPSRSPGTGFAQGGIGGMPAHRLN
jgi:hypothetical protein